MSLISQQTEASITEALQKGIKAKAEEILEEIIEEASQKLTQRLRNLTDSIALNALSYYDMRSDERGLHITVRKELGDNHD